jgi:hypothetical protein
MVTGYLVAYAAFRALFDHSPVMVPSKDILIFLVSWEIFFGRMLLEAFLDLLVACL